MVALISTHYVHYKVVEFHEKLFNVEALQLEDYS